MNGQPEDALDREREIFLEALEQSAPGERSAFLDKACGSDVALRVRLEGLLKHHVEDGFLEEPAPVQPEPSAAAAVGVGALIGHYKLLEKIGEGGCGVVYMAEQERPVRRKVALKVIKVGMDTREVMARFEAERQALAMMDHPNIAKVLDAGATETGRPYFAMELVRGIKITDFCDENNLSTRDRLNLFAQVCRAVQHAHQKGIIHRDLKPGNILVTLNDGVPLPKVIDFGIAKATQGRLTDQTLFTAFKQFLGTPAYMSPEQAQMSANDVDTRSDIYSLGVLLYELLTGKTPFDSKELIAAGLDEMRRIIREKEPARPSSRLSTMAASDLTTVARRRQTEPPKLLNGVRGDLDWIVMKCLEKDRGRRYETANGLSRDIERHLQSEPVSARPPSNLYRFRKLVRRNRLLCGAAFTVAATLVVGVIASTWEAARARRAEQQQSHLKAEAEASRRQAEAARQQAIMTLEASDFADAERLLKADDAADAVAHLSRILRADPGNRAALSQLVTLLTYHSWAVPTLILKHNDRVLSARFSTDGRLIVTASADTAQVWDASSGQPLLEPLKHNGQVYSAQFSPDGKRILSASADHTARVWDAQTGMELLKLTHEDEVYDAQFSPDGELIATASYDNTARVWDTRTGQPLGQPMPHKGRLKCIQFSPDSRRVVTASFDGTARVWDARTGLPVTPYLRHGNNALYCARFSPDGTRVLTGSVDQTARLWDAQSGQSLGEPMRHEAEVYRAQFSPDGQRIVTASNDGTARVGDALTGRPLTEPIKHGNRVCSAQFSPDSQRIVTASDDGTARVWDARTGQPLTNPLRHGDVVFDAQFSPDGKRILTCSYDGTACVWDALMARAVPLSLEETSLIPARFSPDGSRIVTVSNAIAQVWDSQTGQSLTTLLGHSEQVYFAEFSPDGSRIATASMDYTARVWDARTGLPLTGPLKHLDRVYTAQFSPDGLRLVTASWDKTARIWDAQTAQEICTLLGHSGYLVSAQFSPDGTRVVTASWDKTARIWDAKTGRALTEPLQHRARVWSAQFSRDSKRVVTASDDQTARVWDAATGQALTGPLQHRGEVWCAQFSPDGTRVVTVSADQTARVWDANTGRPLTEPMRHDSAVKCAQFSPDGTRVVTTPIPRPYLGMTVAPPAQFSPDGTRLVVATGRARLWDSQTGEPLTELLISTNNATSVWDVVACVWDVGFVPTKLPDWLLPLAEAISGRRLNEKGILEETTIDRPNTIARIRRHLADQPDSGDGVSWGRWLLSNPSGRTISPLATVTTPTYIENRIAQQTKKSLDEATSLALGNAALLRQISEARERGEQVESLWSNANAHAGAAQWDAAKADLVKLIEAQPDEHLSYHLLAPLLLQSGDLQGYRRHCAQVLARFAGTANPVVAERMAKDCLILPGPAIDLEQSARLADIAVTKGRWSPYFPYFEFTKALAEYRQGHFTSAIDWAQKTLAEPDQDFRDAQANLVLAMAEQKCGKLAEARAALDNARAIESKAPKPGSGAVDDHWGTDWIIVRALLEEAKPLIEPQKTDNR